MAARKKAAAARPGVIATIVETISRKQGATADETVEILKKSFPERDPAAMRSTVLIQAAKHCTSKSRDEKRGLVYYRRGRK